MSREHSELSKVRPCGVASKGEKKPLPLRWRAKMAALGAYPMSWEPFYQLEHDRPAEGSQESKQVVSRARLPTDCEKNRFASRWICDGGSSFLGFSPRRLPASRGSRESRTTLDVSRKTFFSTNVQTQPKM